MYNLQFPMGNFSDGAEKVMNCVLSTFFINWFNRKCENILLILDSMVCVADIGFQKKLKVLFHRHFLQEHTTCLKFLAYKLNSRGPDTKP